MYSLQVDILFFCEYVAMQLDVTMADECKRGMPTSNTHVNKNFQTNTFH